MAMTRGEGVARTPVAGVFEAGHTSATTTNGTQVLVEPQMMTAACVL
jgi:hypothetical protein